MSPMYHRRRGAQSGQPPAPPPPIALPSDESDWLRDYVRFLREHKRWWLVPLCLSVGLLLWLAWMTGEPPRPPTYPQL